MKKMFQFLIVLFIALLVTPVMVFAQGDLVLPGINIEQYFLTLGAMIPAVLFLTSGVKKLIPDLKGFAAQFLSWFFAVGLAFLGWWLHIGLFADITIWWHVLLYGLGLGLASNGIFKIEIILILLQVLTLEPKRKVNTY